MPPMKNILSSLLVYITLTYLESLVPQVLASFTFSTTGGAHQCVTHHGASRGRGSVWHYIPCTTAPPPAVGSILGLLRGGGSPPVSHTVAGVAMPPNATLARVNANSPPKTWWALDMFAMQGLQEDIVFLVDSIEAIAKTRNPLVFVKYHNLLALGAKRFDDNTQSKEDTCLSKMTDLVSKMESKELLLVSRLITHSLTMVNIAETRHRFRVIHEEEKQKSIRPLLINEDLPLHHREDSISGTIESIFKESGNEEVTKDEIFERLLQQRVELVLTAHPTEVNRRLLLRKQRKISELLPLIDSKAWTTTSEKDSTKKEIRSIITSMWGSDEIRRKKPTVLKEAIGGVAIIQTVLFEAVPQYIRQLNDDCEKYLNRSLPLDFTPVKFASWIGGDRDGNPNVTPEVTLQVNLMHRKVAASLFLEDLKKLSDDLAISDRYSGAMKELADSLPQGYHDREFYRKVIDHLVARLRVTVKYCDQQQAILEGSSSAISPEIPPPTTPIITNTSELSAPLQTIFDSLTETGYGDVADGLLTDIIRRLNIFGVSLLALDIREEAAQHTKALDAITDYLGLRSFASMSERERIDFLVTELRNNRPMLPSVSLTDLFPADVAKTLQVFETISNFQTEALGSYVISQAETASDVLAVMLLQKQYGMTRENGKLMRISPLYETITALQNAPKTVETLFTLPIYMGAIDGKQEIMVGYSDSAKDGGRIASVWNLYQCQEKLAKIADKYGVELTFFHGKGGTVGRGGSPSAYRSIVSHPPQTINGRFRCTEQGEVITQNYGSAAMALRTLDIYTSAVLREAFAKPVLPSKEWRSQLDRLSETSCAAYRKLVREVPVFVPYFRNATPERELQLLNVGSRPSKRNPKGGIESLRAIPWTFAWTQTRCHLSAWLGVGEAFDFENSDDFNTVVNMYETWPWFRETVDLIAMILSKSDVGLATNYDRLLVTETEEIKLGEDIMQNLKLTRAGLLKITGYDDVDVGFTTLSSSMKYRAPYIDTMNVIQAELLKRFRVCDDNVAKEEKQVIEDALIVSVNGIATGLRNSG